MGIFISVEKTIECVLIAVIYACLLVMISGKILGMMQSCAYVGKKLVKWTRRKNNMLMSRLSLLTLASLLTYCILSLCFSFVGQWSAVIGLAAIVIFCFTYLYADAKHSVKSPVTLTPRLKRLYRVLWLVLAILIYIVVTLLNFADYVWGQVLFTSLKYVVLTFFPVLLVPIVCFANLICLVYEKPKNAKYIREARQKLAASGATVVGITGSYGKTSAKNILSHLLDGDYKVLSTPRSYNTPLGIARALNESEEEFNLFIAEMGARHVGDIEELCSYFTPDYALITGICNQHLESFGSIDNIISEKGKIIKAAKNFTCIAPGCASLFTGEEGKIKTADIVKDVLSDSTGTQFTLTLGGQDICVKTKLLGEHSAYNIGLCALLAYDLGVSAEHIAERIASIEYIEHRLQPIVSNGVNIIDDGYNSNIIGARAALKVLSTFGGRKIVVTPGLVELGILEEEENRALGAQLVGVDRVILVGETLVGVISEGYKEAGGDMEKLTVVHTLTDAQEELKGRLLAGDTVLFLNDLPDMYI